MNIRDNNELRRKFAKGLLLLLLALAMTLAATHALAHTYDTPPMCTPQTVGASIQEAGTATLLAGFDGEDAQQEAEQLFWDLLDQWHTLCIDGGTITPASAAGE